MISEARLDLFKSCVSAFLHFHDEPFQSDRSVLIFSLLDLLFKPYLREDTIKTAVSIFLFNILYLKVFFFHCFTILSPTIILAIFTRLAYTHIFSLTPSVIAQAVIHAHEAHLFLLFVYKLSVGRPILFSSSQYCSLLLRFLILST